MSKLKENAFDSWKTTVSGGIVAAIIFLQGVNELLNSAEFEGVEKSVMGIGLFVWAMLTKEK